MSEPIYYDYGLMEDGEIPDKQVGLSTSPTIQELIQEIDLCLELLGYEREALERMEISEEDLRYVDRKEIDWKKVEEIMEDGYEECLRYGVFPGNLEDGR